MQKISKLITVFLAVALVGVLGAGCTKSAKKARHLNRAEKFFAAGDFDPAEIEYINVMHLDSTNALASGRLGIIYSDQGRFGRAVPLLQRSLQYDTNNLDIHMKLGSVYQAGGRLKEARERAAFVLERRPQDPEAPTMLAESSVTPKEIEDARNRFAKAASKGAESPGVMVGKAVLLLRDKDLAGAESLLDKAVATDPKLAPAYSALGSIYWLKKDLKRADQAFKTAADLSSPRSARRLEYAQFKFRAGEMAEGKSVLEEMERKAPDCLMATLALAQVAAG